MKRTRVNDWKDLKSKANKHLEYIFYMTRYLLYNGSASFLWSKLNRYEGVEKSKLYEIKNRFLFLAI